MAPSRRKRDGRSSRASQESAVMASSPLPSPANQWLDDGAPESAQQPALSFPVVCIGASAGGLEAFTQLLAGLPTDSGMAFVLVSHLSPSHARHLAEILAPATPMPGGEGKGEPRVQPNRVDVIP